VLDAEVHEKRTTATAGARLVPIDEDPARSGRLQQRSTRHWRSNSKQTADLRQETAGRGGYLYQNIRFGHTALNSTIMAVFEAFFGRGL
jgi:hypothetical protein